MLPRSNVPPTVRALVLRLAAVVALLAGCLVPGHAVAGAAEPDGPLAPTKAWVLVDADTGLVLAAGNARTPMRVASTFKILTALVVRRRVPLGDVVPISPRAASMPALKISVQAGQRWNADDLLHSMLLASANDAAVALAERAGGGSLVGFDRALTAEAGSLHLADHPLLHDPAGLDDGSSFEGGNLISARDLAIAARAFLADPFLAAVADTPTYHFSGGDGRRHEVQSHNAFLSSYPGAIGLKTGFTERSGSSLVAAARRGGRTLIAVVVDSTNTIAAASTLLDRGFATPVGREPAADRLPASPPSVTYVGAGAAVVPRALPLRARVPVVAADQGLPGGAVVLGLLALLVVLLVVRRRQLVVASMRTGPPRRPPPRRPPPRRPPPAGGASSRHATSPRPASSRTSVRR